MLTASRSSSGFRQDTLFEVTASGAVIGSINDTRSTFELGNESFRINRSGILGPDYHLNSADRMIASAGRKPFLNHYTLTFNGKAWTFKATGMLATKFGLFENDTQTGTVSSGSWLNRVKGITADLPDDLPREVQMFLLSLFIKRLTTPTD
jgi:hypothetical protein